MYIFRSVITLHCIFFYTNYTLWKKLAHQECYMDDDCSIQRTKSQMRNYLHTFHLKNGRVKFHVNDFRRMIGALA